MSLITIPEAGGASGDFTPVLKFKANAGRMVLVQRTQDTAGEWVSTDEDITNKQPQFAMDFGSIEVGWLDFGTGSAPLKLTVPFGQPLPVKPEGKRANAQGRMVDCFQMGFRMKLAGQAIKGPDGNALREFCSTSKTVIAAINDLHSLFEAAPEAAAGKIPVVKFVDVKAVPVSTPKGTNTFYAPVFEIVTWADRPVDMLGPRTVPPPAARPVVQMAPIAAAAVAAAPTANAIGDEIPF